MTGIDTYVEYIDPEGLNVPTSLMIHSKDSGFTHYIEEKLEHFPVHLKLKVEKRLLRNVLSIEIDSSSFDGVPLTINKPISLSFLSVLSIERRRVLIQSLVSDLIEWINEEQEQFKKDTIRLLVN